jgi:hypothetical protein
MSWQHEWKEGNCETVSVREVLINRERDLVGKSL